MEANATHRAEVIRVSQILPHDNADKLEIIPVFGNQVVVQKGTFRPGDLAIYIQPDSLVDTRLPEFSFLQAKDKEPGFVRVKAKRLRGVLSHGFLIKSIGFEEGADMAEILHVGHWEPDEKVVLAGNILKVPSYLQVPIYDIQPLYRYWRVIPDGTIVTVTEKLHGANVRFCFHEGKMWVGSRRQWIEDVDGSNTFWGLLLTHKGIEPFCKDNPGQILWGEMYGCVQSLKYGMSGGRTKFAAFDVYDPESRRFWNYQDFVRYTWVYNVPTVPQIAFRMDYDYEAVRALAEGNTTVKGAKHLREGIVVRTFEEQYHERIGRLQFKVINPDFEG